MSLQLGTLQRQIRMLNHLLAPVLDSQSSGILEQVVVATFPSTGPREEMRYVVNEERPLIFRAQTIDGIEVQPDIFCKMRISGDSSSPILEQNVVIRVWSLSSRSSYRREWDARRVRTLLEKQGYKRVIARYHFDFANPGQLGPVFHLQFGGRPVSRELYWFPEISVPRIMHPPVDLILASEMVLANFYPDEFERLRREPEWRSLVRTSEDNFQRSYYEDCRNCIADLTSGRREATLLSHLWNGR